jgi:hypothetical protein
VAAIVAGAQIVGGAAAPWIRQRFARRTSALILWAALDAATLAVKSSQIAPNPTRRHRSLGSHALHTKVRQVTKP